MCLFAADAIRRRYKYPRVFQIQLIAISLGSFFTITIVLLLQIIKPIGQFVILMGSMVIANAMVISALAMERIHSDIKNSRGLIEAALSLGDTPRNSISTITKRAMRAGMLPTTNRLAILGVINIPGLISGMVIGGVNQIKAVIYQIIIFLMILLSGMIAEIVMGYLFIKEYFTERYQLNEQLLSSMNNNKR